MPRPLICQLPSQRPPGPFPTFPGDVGGVSPLSPLKGPRGQRQALRAWLERSWGVCEGPGRGGSPFHPRPSHHQSRPPHLSPVAVLTPGLKNAEGCWWGEVNWKQENMAFLSRRPGLGKQRRVAFLPLPSCRGEGWGTWLSCLDLFGVSASPGSLTFTGNSKLPVLHPWYETLFPANHTHLGSATPAPLHWVIPMFVPRTLRAEGLSWLSTVSLLRHVGNVWLTGPRGFPPPSFPRPLPCLGYHH